MIPYFKWFPAEMEAETNFRCMTLEERGLFITCLNLAWVNNGLPSDLGELARMLRVNRNKLGKLWRGRVGVMFEQVGGRLRNTRQELDRQEVGYKSAKALESANVRWKRIAPKNDSQCLRTDTDTDTEKIQNRTESAKDFYNEDENWAAHISDPHPGRRTEKTTPPAPASATRPESSEDEMKRKHGPSWRRLLFLRDVAAYRELTPEEREEYAQAQKQA